MAVVNKLEVKITGDAEDLQKSLKSASISVAKWGAASITAAGAVTAAMTAHGLKVVDSQAKLARALGGTNDALQSLKMAAGDTGLEGLDASLNRLNRRLGAAEFGAGAAAVTVEALGLDLKALSALDTDERLVSLSKSIEDAGLSSEQAARHLQNLGFEQAQATEFFKSGISNLGGYREEMDKLGLSMTEIDSRKVEAANDAMGVFGDITEGVSKRLAIEFAPVLTAISNLLLETAKESEGVGKATEDAFGMIINGSAFVLDALDGIKRVFELTADGIILYFSKFWQKVSELAAEALESLSKVPGVDFSETIASLEGFAETSKGVVDAALNNISDTLERPLAGEKFKQFIKDAEEAATAAAEASIAAQADVPGGAGLAAPVEVTDDEKKKREEMEKRLDLIREELMTKAEIEAEQHAIDMETLRQSLEAKLLTQQEFDELSKATKKNHEAEMTAIEEDAANARTQIAEAEAAHKKAVLGDALSALTTLMNSESKKMFKIGKAASIAQAIIATNTGMAEALKLGWPLGPIAAGAIGLAGFANVNNIRSQSFGGGGSTSAPSATQEINANATPTQPAGGEAQRTGGNTVINLSGDTFGRSQVRDLIDKINEERGDGSLMVA